MGISAHPMIVPTGFANNGPRAGSYPEAIQPAGDHRRLAFGLGTQMQQRGIEPVTLAMNYRGLFLRSRMPGDVRPDAGRYSRQGFRPLPIALAYFAQFHLMRPRGAAMVHASITPMADGRLR